jgi:hypothetical protein
MPAPTRTMSSVGWLAPSIALGPLIVVYLGSCFISPSGVLTLVICALGTAVLFTAKRQTTSDEPERHAPPRGAPVLFVSALIAVAGLMASPWFAYLAWVVTLTVVIWVYGRRRQCCALVPTLILLALTIQIPFDLERPFLAGMQMASAKAADKLLDLWNSFHLLQGSAVSTSDRRLFLDEAAQGSGLLGPTLAAVAFLLGWLHRPLLQMAIVLLSTPLWVVLVNGVRMGIVAHLVERHRFAADAGSAFVVGWAASFIVSVGLSMSFAELLQFSRALFRPRESSEDVKPQPAASVPHWAIYVFVGASALSLTLQVPSWFDRSTNSAVAANTDLNSVPDSAFAEVFGPFTRADASRAAVDRFDVARDVSRRWEYKAPFAYATLSLEQPIRDWGELTTCLRSTGWIVGRRDVRNLELGGRAASIVEIAVSKPATTQVGRIWFTLFDRMGNPAAPPGDELVRRILRHPTPKEMLDALRADADDRPPYFQLQLFVEGPEPLGDADLSAADSFFLDSCRRIIEASTSGGAIR